MVLVCMLDICMACHHSAVQRSTDCTTVQGASSAPMFKHYTSSLIMHHKASYFLLSHWSPLITTDHHWSLLITTDHYWSPLIPTDKHWSPLITTDHHWSPLITTGRQWSPLITTDHHWSLLIWHYTQYHTHIFFLIVHLWLLLNIHAYRGQTKNTTIRPFALYSSVFSSFQYAPSMYSMYINYLFFITTVLPLLEVPSFIQRDRLQKITEICVIQYIFSRWNHLTEKH
jgi:hypothetical protein